MISRASFRLALLPLVAGPSSTAWAQQPDTLRPRSEPAAPATLFKLGLDAPRATAGYWGFTLPLYAGVERQLGRHWSLTADVNAGIGAGNGLSSAVQLGRFGTSVGTRYYYSQARRQRRGKPVMALGGTYLQLQGSAEFTRHYYYFGEALPIYRCTPSAELLWGYQRRLGRYGFLDAGAGVRVLNSPWYNSQGNQTTQWSVEPVLRLRAGLAF
jgi:hypothetical protein